MVIVDLTAGEHTVKWTLSGYSQLIAVINVSSAGAVTCKSVTGGSCGSSTPPGVVVSGSTVTGYLLSGATPTPTPGYNSWVASMGGATGIKGNLIAVGNIIDGYIGIASLGFTVTLGNVGTTIDYYLGIGG
jgi:hypothetical protein